MEKLVKCPRRLGDARRKTHPRFSRAREEGREEGEKPVSSALSTPAFDTAKRCRVPPPRFSLFASFFFPKD